MLEYMPVGQEIRKLLGIWIVRGTYIHIESDSDIHNTDRPQGITIRRLRKADDKRGHEKRKDEDKEATKAKKGK